MKFTLSATFLLLAIYTMPAYAQLTYTSNENTHLWGTVTVEDLEKEPYAKWYQESQNEFTPTLSTHYYKNLQDVTVKIFIGTWCGDTQNFAPKFIEIWKNAGLQESQLELIALRSGELYKQGPNREELAYDIHRVPTFVFERGGKEIGRIVEHPTTDLETDIAQISAGIPSTPSYNVVTELQSLFRENSLDSLNSQYRKIARSLFGAASYVGELTTYAKKLHHDGEIEKANYTYELNTALFRYHPYSHYRLGVFKFECDDFAEAKEHLEKCKSIQPDYQETNAYLEKIAVIEGKNEKQ